MSHRERAAFGPREAAAYAREYAQNAPTSRRRARRRRLRHLARRAQAAWRAWRAAGEVA